MMFYPGQIVVCVAPDSRGRLNMGFKYPVSEIGGHSGIAVRLALGPNPMPGERTDDGFVSTSFWRESRFRPLDDGDLALIAQKHKIKEKME